MFLCKNLGELKKVLYFCTMASFELIGFVKKIDIIGTQPRVTIGEYVQGRRDKSGKITGETMDLWYVFFHPSTRRLLNRFKCGDEVIVKATIHQAADVTNGSGFAYAVNGECIKHFHTRDLAVEENRERRSAKIDSEMPDVEEAMMDDF